MLAAGFGFIDRVQLFVLRAVSFDREVDADEDADALRDRSLLVSSEVEDCCFINMSGPVFYHIYFGLDLRG